MVEFVSLKRHFDCYAEEYEAAALRALRSGLQLTPNLRLTSFNF